MRGERGDCSREIWNGFVPFRGLHSCAMLEGLLQKTSIFLNMLFDVVNVLHNGLRMIVRYCLK